MIPDPPPEPDAPRGEGPGGEPAVRVLVGLGNPGPRYAGTRHNVGFEVLDLVAARLGARPEPLQAGGRTLADLYQDPGGAFCLVWPMTFMNRSGGPVAAVLRRLEREGARPAELFVVVDDIHLPLGALRIRPRGSAGGHNGLRSLEEVLGTGEWARLRIGVGAPRDPGETVEHVLGPFRRSERPVLEETLETASWAAEDWIRGAGLDELQGRYNRRSPP